MDEKYIVQFVTLLGAAVTSIFLAIRVYNKQTDIVRALIILLVVIVVFYVIGKIVHKVMMNIHINIEQTERERLEAAEQQENEESASDEDNTEDDGEEAEQNGSM